MSSGPAAAASARTVGPSTRSQSDRSRGRPADSRVRFIGGTGVIPRRSRRGYAPSQRQFPNVFVEHRRICTCRRIGYGPDVAERPTGGGSSVRPRWKQSVPQCGNQTTSTGRTLAEKVTPSPSKSVGLPEAKTTSGARTRQRIGVPGAWHSQQSHPLQSMNPTRILTVPGVGGTANLKLPTQRCGAVGFLRVHAEEDVKHLIYRFAACQGCALSSMPHVSNREDFDGVHI